MKSILLIGLGRFGRHIAMHLSRLGHQVMAVDNVESRVEAALPLVSKSATARTPTFSNRSASAISTSASSPSATIFKARLRRPRS